MPTITAIKPQKRKDYFNLYVDDEFVCGLTAQAILDERLAKGQEISRTDIERIVKEHEVNKLLDKTFNWLSFRPRSHKELVDYLKKPKGKFRETASDQAQQLVLARIEEKSYIDDLAFARWWIESRIRFRPRSRRLIVLELQSKGISRDLAEQAFESISESTMSDEVVKSDFDLALVIAQKNLRKYQKLEPRQAQQKLTALLARRGFDWDTIKSVFQKLLQADI